MKRFIMGISDTMDTILPWCGFEDALWSLKINWGFSTCRNRRTLPQEENFGPFCPSIRKEPLLYGI